MASTSLRRQVDALRNASSGTSSGYIQRKKGKPSLLLTPDQAADVDLSSVRETAVMGLQRLEAVDQSFSAFQSTLFSKDAEKTLRDLQTQESNERIDKSITSFLALLSPHFSSREAHFCLEYLIRHYKIYQYNVDAVVECCLPWHDTVAFARLVQLLSLKGSRWEFLTPVQTTGSPLPREAIARRCARDFGLLRFLCVSARRAAAAAGESKMKHNGAPIVSAATAAGRAKLFSFHAAVVVEALASLRSASEALLRALVPTVVHGLSATSSPEYQMASYMILSAVSAKGPLSSEVTATALNALVCKPCQGGLEPSLLCALAVAQTQVGFASKDPSKSAAALLPSAAFMKLSKMESVAGVLAGLATKFDATAFLWLLLQSYVQHLSHENSEEFGVSLTRLCTYPHWPSHSLPRLIRRLVDRLLKSYLTIAQEAEIDDAEGDRQQKARRASRMKTETQRVLRVLGQRYPREVDAAVGKVSRYVAKSKQASEAAAASAEDDGIELVQAAEVDAFREATLSALLVSTFAGAELAQRLPLRDEEHMDTEGEDAYLAIGVHESLMVALEHSSGAVRVRAVEQLSRAISESKSTEEDGQSPDAHTADVHTARALLGRLRDEDPDVVVAITDSHALVKRVLLRSQSGSIGDDTVDSTIAGRAKLVSAAATAAAAPWLAALSESRPKHPVASAARVLSGLVRLSSAAVVSASAEEEEGDVSSVYQLRKSALRLILECLPGPHAMARVKLALQSTTSAGAGETDGDHVNSKARKKALRVVGRVAVSALMDLAGTSKDFQLFSGLDKILRKDGTRGKKGGGGAMDVDANESKSKGLKAMSEEVCDVLAGGIAEGTETKVLQDMADACDFGARWLVEESLSRAISLATSNASDLASLLAHLATGELRLRGDAEAGGSVSPVRVGSADILGYLEMCASHLARPERPLSLFREDHLSSPLLEKNGCDAHEDVGANAMFPLRLGDMLASALRTTAPESIDDAGTNADGQGCVSTMVLQGYGYRPLPALAAIAVAGASVSLSMDERFPKQDHHQRQHTSQRDLVTTAAQALRVAATFVRAASEAGGRTRGSTGHASNAADIVAVFPAAIIAVVAEDKNLQKAGLLFISTIATHGSALCVPLSSGKSPSKAKGKNASAGSCPKDSEYFPLPEVSQDEGAKQPVPLRAPTLSTMVELARVLTEKNGQSTLDGAELTRHLASVSRGDGGIEEKASIEIARFMVAWAVRLGWKDPVAAARLLECFRVADSSLRECGPSLLGHVLESEELSSSPANARLLKMLLESTLTAAPVDDCKGQSDGKATPTSPKQPRSREPIDSSNTSFFHSDEAEAFFHKALRTAGQLQSIALLTLTRLSSVPAKALTKDNDGDIEVDMSQRRRLLRTLVEASLEGAGGSAVAAAAKALLVNPGEVAALVRELAVSSSSPAVGANGDKKVSRKRRQSRSSTKLTTSSDWVVVLGGTVELVQALCTTSRFNQQQSTRKKGRASPVSTNDTFVDGGGWWDGAAPLELAVPLFNILPHVLTLARSAGSVGPTSGASAPSRGVRDIGSTGSVSAAEYALWLTMDVIGTVLRRRSLNGAEELYIGDRAGEDAERVLNCISENPSPQTRNSGLALLSRMATLFPAAMASRLRTLLNAVCAAAKEDEGGEAGGGSRAALRQTQKAVMSVVPALKAHGAEAGVGAHFVVQVFADALSESPVHSRRTLFGTLVDSLGEDSLAIIAALLLRRSMAREGDGDGRTLVEGEDSSPALAEFVHQTVHGSGAVAQIKTLVGLVQACHRISVNASKNVGQLTGRALEDAIESFSSSREDDGKLDYMELPLGEDRTASDAREAYLSFMTLDLKSLTKGEGSTVPMKRPGPLIEKMLSFVRDHLVSKPLLMTVAAAAERSDVEDEGVQEGFLLLCEELLLLLRTLAACQQGIAEEGHDMSGLSWSTLQAIAYAVFETVQSLLSVPSFVAVTQELLQHQDPHLRRKALQMFTRRLDPARGGTPRLSPGEELLFIDMIPSLRMVAKGKMSAGDDEGAEGDMEEVMGRSSSEVEPMEEDANDSTDEEESLINRQTALLSLDVLARVLGRRHQDAFMGVLDDVTSIVAREGSDSMPGADGSLRLRASAFLLVATLCAVLGVRAFPCLPRFFPAMLTALETQQGTTSSEKEDQGSGQSLLWTSALSAVATVAAGLPSFISPYLGRILAVALRPAAGDVGAGGRQAADRVLSLLAGGVEPRLLIPAVCGAYTVCVAGGGTGAASSVARLLAYVQEIISGLEKEAASAALPQFTRLLTQALDFRRVASLESSAHDQSSAEYVEKEASSSLVALVMRLSEVELRPLFLHLCEWKSAVSGDGPSATLGVLDRRLSFYRVLDGLAAALKSIFTPYFAHVLPECCDDMEAASALATSLTDTTSIGDNSSSKRKRASADGRPTKKRGHASRPEDTTEDDDQDDGRGTSPEVWSRRSAAARLVLSALRRCFQSDRSGFVDKSRFDLLLPAIVSQLDCGADFPTVAGEDEVASCRRHAEELVGPCLGQLASACGKDALWKALANAVLMKTRSGRAGVRVAALVSLRQCFQVVGEEFLALLPECLPFLSELLEDGHPEVESECRALIKYIEDILGESIESYLV